MIFLDRRTGADHRGSGGHHHAGRLAGAPAEARLGAARRAAPLVGSIVRFVAGHDWSQTRESVSFGDPRRQDVVIEPRPTMSRTEAELAALDAEIEAAEKAERIRRLEAEVQAKRAGRGRK